MTTEQIYRRLLDLVEKSEARIDRTNEMIQQLAHSCKCNADMYDKHLTSLELSRDSAQHTAATSIETIKDLTAILARLRDDYQAQITSLKAELHTLRDDYRKELEEMRRDAKDLSLSYRRIAERIAVGSGAVAEVSLLK